MSYDLLFKKANDLYLAGALNQAEELYRQILEVVPENPDVLNMLGLTAHAKGCFNEACDYFYKALQFAPGHLPIYFNLAVSLTSAGKLHEAVKAYLKVIGLNPDIKEVYNNLGGIYENLHDYNTAKEYYRKASALDSAYLEPAVNLAVLENNVAALQQIAKQHPCSALPPYYLAQLNLKQNNPLQAEQYIRTAQNLDDTSFEIYLSAGNIFLKLGKTDEAEQAFSKVLKLNAKCVPALINLGMLENDENLYRAALDLEPDNAEAHAGLATLLYKQKRTLEALEEYRKAVIINPDMPAVSNNLALILKDGGDYRRAIDLLLNAVKQSPENTEIAINLAETLTLFYNQNHQEAEKIAEQWKLFMPDNLFAARVFASFKGENCANTAQYAEALFDAFAETYEQTMQNINYAAIQKLQSLGFAPVGKVLDLGCGTGLVGQAFKSSANSFVGVDISQKMLDAAASKSSYSALIKDDVTDFLCKNELKFNFIIALDAIEYVDSFESLAAFLENIPFIFTIENAADEVSNYQLGTSGRYRHNPQYIRKTLANVGYKKIKEYPLVLRQENGADVNGTLFWAE